MKKADRSVYLYQVRQKGRLFFVLHVTAYVDRLYLDCFAFRSTTNKTQKIYVKEQRSIMLFMKTKQPAQIRADCLYVL
ncbi:hypothetical protein AM501_13340 [Aneurinibacillus migulanus]|uniref:Uncharacterized protein n=1 Tax=Aneurinibacillus migulanus TaxID=47500 RepID=A0A0D1XKJ9_ANEMI|nr:hypothetical protein TS65_21755 [Aneurinibacillus migulanus]KIV59125.1 hypothetical protein TS64_03275 [Aneurinibacillus migulanus]KON95035.1 hypothetical protein AF333_05610 [Aneurinibacillus migulanus]KPD07850.1 hypothetical protein AM501_13340 [Aneurinibacillus migulanus]